MGSWNGTCAVSNLHITAGQDVAVFMLLKNNRERTFCYGNALYDVCPVPFYGKYNDYGAVEECHGFGLNVVVEALRDRLYEFGQGANEYHDCEVKKATFNVDKLFDADHEDRLGIEYIDNYDEDAYDLRELEKKKEEKSLSESQLFELDRLANKIKKVDNFRRVTHVQIHGDIFRAIMEKWYIEDYVGDGKGDKGYNNNYHHLYFKDMVASIPEYMRRMKENHVKTLALKAELDAAGNTNPALFNRFYRSLRSEVFEWNDECMAGKWMEYFRRDSSSVWALVDVHEFVTEFVEKEEWDALESFVTEVLTAAWVNSFMAHSRKLWVPTSGQGSQNGEHLPYQVLANAVQDVIKAERAEQAEWDEEFEDEDFEETPTQA